MTISVPRDFHGRAQVQGLRITQEIAPEDEVADGPFALDGERVSISERLVVAPVWGRLEKRPLTEGQWLEKGSVIGFIREDGTQFPLVCHDASMFVSWLAYENERVPPGRALARLRSVEE